MAKSFTEPEKINNIPYISCIRIHGMRILPPIMTEEKKYEMQYYKELAVKIENDIKSRSVSSKNVTDFTDEYSDSDSGSSSSCNNVTTTSDEETTQIFTESCRSDVLNMLGDMKREISTVPSIESDIHIPEKPNCESSSILYKIGAGDNNNDKETTETIVEIENVDNQQLNKQSLIRSNSYIVENVTTDSQQSDKQLPSLIRSNSYILDTPSPYLLALMNQTKEEETKTVETKKRRTWDLEKAKQKWSSIENDLNTKNFTQTNPESYNSISIPNSPEVEPEHDVPWTPKQKTDDIKPEVDIRDIIDRIQTQQSKQMTELIARQKQEQETMLQLFAEQQALVLAKLQTFECQIPEAQNSEVLFSESKKKSNESDEHFSPNCDEINQNFSRVSNDDTICSESSLSIELPSSKFDVDTSNSVVSNHLDAVLINGVSHQIISTDINSTQLNSTKDQIWAATVIQSAIRGFLVRRLLNTERVQNLITTIRDSLMCAVELHQETVEKIQPADVELHRRLILQVTAACHAFHDTFFEINRSDQLQIIAMDRERLKEKLLRPQLSRNSSLTSTTQRILERRLRRRSTDSLMSPVSRTSSSRSNYSDYRLRTRSLGLSDAAEKRKTSPQNDVMRRAMSFGANKKPWR